jgi:hypothetical protein
LLTALQQKIGQKLPGSRIDFDVRGLRVSPQVEAAQECPIRDLITDARAQAQKLANAASGSVGPILALSDASSGSLIFPTGGVYFVSPPGPGCSSASSFSSENGVSFSSTVCAIVVKFSLLQP